MTTQEAHTDGPVQGESPPAFLKALAQVGIDPQEVIGFLDQLIARQINGVLKQAKLPETIQALHQQATRMEAALHQAPVAAATEALPMAGGQEPPGQNGAAMRLLEILAKAMTKDETMAGLPAMAAQFAQMGQLMSAMWKGVMEPMADMEAQATKRVLDTMGSYYKTGGDFPWSGGKARAPAPAPDSAAMAHELAKRITVGEKAGTKDGA